MESPRKFNDCYFYYYSTCTKGDNCIFRHEPLALGCETMCSLWQQGKCLDKRCKLRHMELRKNRKQIPCYWENQPGGCRKKHCPFMHKNPDARSDGILPSQPGAQQFEPVSGAGEQTPCADTLATPVVPTHPAHAPHAPLAPHAPHAPHPTLGHPAMPHAVQPVPMLWQQQRQVVLDSGILGVLPASPDLMARREPSAYPLPGDPLVVKFEEESDGESPHTTPTKVGRPLSPSEAPAESQELLLLERIQAEAAAYYGYTTPSEPERRQRPSNHYERLSLDEITGKKTAEAKSSLDFKVMSLDEIRAKKRHSAENSKPITLNLNRKRKLSSQETIIDSDNKIIKLVRSNSIVYRKFDKPNDTAQKVDKLVDSRKRTLSEQSDVLEVPDDELDDCYKFKKVKVDDYSNKPTFIRTKSLGSDVENKTEEKTSDSDSEVQIVCEKICYNAKRSGEVIDLESSSVDIVDLSDDEDEDVVLTDLELGLGKSVPDVVASCQQSGILDDIDTLLDDNL